MKIGDWKSLMNNLSIFLLGLSLFIIAPLSVCGADATLFEDKAIAPILDKDIVRARKSAIREVKKKLLHKALFEFIENEVFEENIKLLDSKIFPLVNTFLRNIKVLNEHIDGKNFEILMQGKFDLPLLVAHLKQNYLPLKSASWRQVTVLIPQEDDVFLRQEFIDRLKMFHLAPRFVPSPSVLIDTTTLNEEAIAQLFVQYPQNNILYFYQRIKDEENINFLGVQLTILRKFGHKNLNTIRVLADHPLSKEEFAVESKLLQEKMQALFSLQSLKTEAYETGEASIVRLEVSGLQTPKQRQVFEDAILKKDRRIKQYQRFEISLKRIVYLLESSDSMNLIGDRIQEHAKGFEIIWLEIGNTAIRLDLKIPDTSIARQLKQWTPNAKMSEEIMNIYQLPEMEPIQMPALSEMEPNNDSSEINLLPNNTLIFGSITGRSDEDIYRFELNGANRNIEIEWAKLGKTNLAPFLRLYDEEYNFLSAYRLRGTQKIMNIQYQLPEDYLGMIYFRISDFYGFIPGETGGYQFADYIFKVTQPQE